MVGRPALVNRFEAARSAIRPLVFSTGGGRRGLACQSPPFMDWPFEAACGVAQDMLATLVYYWHITVHEPRGLDVAA